MTKLATLVVTIQLWRQIVSQSDKERVRNTGVEKCVDRSHS